MPPETAAETVVENAAEKPDLLAALEEVFGYTAFRPHQREAVEATLAGRDCLLVMPTGAGKSLTFQLPAAISQGTTLVISPLIALMRDQVIALRERTSFSKLGAACLNSSQSLDEQREILTLLRAGKLKLLYVAPERLRAPAFADAVRNSHIARFVVDEAHCISEWGHDFRPDYLAIKDFVAEIGHPPVFAATATATTRVQGSIAHNLAMREPEIIVGGFNRPNLHFSVVKCKNELDRSNKLFKALPKLVSRGGSGLIYVATRRQCEEIGDLAAQALAPLGLRAGAYHAGLESNLRSEMQEGWLRGDPAVLVATNAFGMGIDKSDVRFVVHWGYPESPESYYQEAGRAGRDGRKARATILSFGVADRRIREFFITNEAIEGKDLNEALQRIARTAGRDGEENVARVRRYFWEQLGWREPKPRVVVGKLERAGLLEKISELPEATILRVKENSVPPRILRDLERELEREKNERLARLDEMAQYVKGHKCRRRVLLDYFGDDDPTSDEWCCDVCDARKNGGDLLQNVAPDLAQGKVEAPGAIGDIYDLLQALDALWPQVGKAKLSKVLRGSKSADIERYKTQTAFGALSHLTGVQVTVFLEELIRVGLLHQGDEDEYYVVRVTRAGREAWEARSGVEIELPGRTRTRVETKTANSLRAIASFEEGEEDEELFARLRDWRREKAREENVPPYIIFGDKALREIARQKPQTEDELALVSGVGPKKLDLYGEEVLEVVGEC